MAKEPKKKPINWRLLLAIAALALVTASAAMATLRVRRFVITDPQFNLSPDRKDAVDIVGLRYGSRSKVLRIFAPDYSRSVYAVPLEERRRRLLSIDWVEDASISRIWPDRLVVHVRERKPIAFVLFRSGVQLIDGYGVFLDPPPQAQFAFPVLGGIREQDTLEDRRQRVRAFRRVLDDMGYLAKDISEINVADPEDIHIVAQVEDRAVELLMGDGDFARRYQNFVSHLPEIRKRSPEGKRFDLRLDDRITAKE